MPNHETPAEHNRRLAAECLDVANNFPPADDALAARVRRSGGSDVYGANFPDLTRRAADYVDKILRGAKQADIPVEQPTKFDLVINLTTAKAVRLKISESFLLRADEVIE